MVVPPERRSDSAMDVSTVRHQTVLRVLAVGVDDYPGGYRLNYAMKDARDVARRFEDWGAGTFEKVDVRLLTDGGAGRLAILEGLDWLRNESRPSDVSVFYYSAHGGNDPPIGFYLAPSRFRDRFWRKTMISGDELRDEVRSIPGHVVLLMETCYSGALLRDGPVGDNIAVLGATRWNEETRGGNRFRRSHFTRALIEGLNGVADVNEDGLVDLDELANYIEERLVQIRFGRKQHLMGHIPDGMATLALSRL
jgi:Caspase domain